MAYYTFENTITGKIYVEEMPMSEREQYLKDNPEVRQILTSPPTLDSVRLGITKPPSDFQKYVLGKVKEKNPLGSVEKRWTINKEV